MQKKQRQKEKIMAEKFKAHKMYCKGKPFMAKTYKEHLALKKKGCGHKKPNNGSKKN